MSSAITVRSDECESWVRVRVNPNLTDYQGQRMASYGCLAVLDTSPGTYSMFTLKFAVRQNKR